MSLQLLLQRPCAMQAWVRITVAMYLCTDALWPWPVRLWRPSGVRVASTLPLIAVCRPTRTEGFLRVHWRRDAWYLRLSHAIHKDAISDALCWAYCGYSPSQFLLPVKVTQLFKKYTTSFFLCDIHRIFSIIHTGPCECNYMYQPTNAHKMYKLRNYLNSPTYFGEFSPSAGRW